MIYIVSRGLSDIEKLKRVEMEEAVKAKPDENVSGILVMV